MGLNWNKWYAWYPVKLTKGRGIGCWAWRREVQWCDWNLHSRYRLGKDHGAESVSIREYRLPVEANVEMSRPDPLRTYDAWAKDETGEPQTWEQYMARSRS